MNDNAILDSGICCERCHVEASVLFQIGDILQCGPCRKTVAEMIDVIPFVYFEPLPVTPQVHLGYRIGKSWSNECTAFYDRFPSRK